MILNQFRLALTMILKDQPSTARRLYLRGRIVRHLVYSGCVYVTEAYEADGAPMHHLLVVAGYVAGQRGKVFE